MAAPKASDYEPLRLVGNLSSLQRRDAGREHTLYTAVIISVLLYTLY